MEITQATIDSRDFLIQFNEIIDEFGAIIPWLNSISNLKYATNGLLLSQKILSALSLSPSEKLYSYILKDSNDIKEYVGGLLHFSRSPEHFNDLSNELLKEDLSNQGFSYVTCLQIRNGFRGNGYATQLAYDVFSSILEEFPQFWGVISNKKLLPFYQSMGAKVVNNPQNTDNILILTRDRHDFHQKTYTKF